jgi:hypothetical protein
MSWRIVNLSTGTLTIQSSGANTITTINPSESTIITCILTSGTSAASWSAISGTGIVNPGTINQLAYYAATGSTVSGLTGANSAMLYTDPTGVPAFATLGNGQLMIGGSGASPTPGTLTAGTGINITNGVNSITISGLAWSVISTSQSMSNNAGYITNGGSLITLTLPTTSPIGAVMSVVGDGAPGWKIAQNASQSIRFGSSTTSIGTGGSLASTNAADSISLVCTNANLTWTVLGAPQGAITVV